MLYDLDWLKEGEKFPPYPELARLTTYKQNRLLFEHRIQDVFGEYKRRLWRIINKFNEINYDDATAHISFNTELDYFEPVAVKTADIVAGSAPTITMTKPDISEEEWEADEGAAYTEAAEKAENNLKAIIEDNDLNKKLLEVIIDVSRFGDAVARVYKDETDVLKGAHANFTCISPEMWFPIVDRSVKELRLYDVIAWVIDKTPDKKEFYAKRFELHAQVHEAGKYTEYVFTAKGEMEQTQVGDGSIVNVERYTIGKMSGQPQVVTTGFKSSVIRDFHNLTTSSNIFGINDYDRIGPIIAELDVRYTLENLVLDKHTAPSIATAEENLHQNRDGSWGVDVGGVFVVRDGQYPQYLTWDASLQANHTMIEKLEKHLWSLSEMGAVLNDDSFGQSQGWEALETRLSNARLKARRMGTGLSASLKKLISVLSEVGYEFIPVKDLSIQFNDGLPMTECHKADIASKEVGGGAIKDVETVLMERYGKTKREAEEIAAKIKSTTNPFESSFFNSPADNEEEETEQKQTKVGFATGGNANEQEE